MALSFLRPTRRVFLCLAIAVLLALPAAHAADVVVVQSKAFALYDKAVEGFMEVFKGKGSVHTVIMEKKGRLADPGSLADEVRQHKPRVILAIGLRAAKSLKAEISDIPIVFCMAMHPLQNKLKSKTSTGVELEPWPRDQLQAFADVIPNLKRVGIIYDPKRTGRFVESAKKAAVEIGLQLVARPVDERKDVLKALNDIVRGADALWLIRDATVLTREFFNHTLIVQVEEKMPLLAYSPQFVKKGAICSYATDYPSQGRKAAEIVLSILGGTSPADISIQAPMGTLTINIDSAAKAGVKVPDKVLRMPGVKVFGK